MAYKITFKKSVSKDLKKIDSREADRILKKLNTDLAVSADQFPELQGQFAGLRKYRVGNYRVIYALIGDSVLIVRIQHRKDVYRN
ncbi:MAG TPA: addiction module toxin RelE [Lentisphaeria bacterium]|nr:MAG: addiction module toxin RelE [Lentisphaerae bacterium GWF2_49_21]HBC87818.1 addiction module toxin RelE [Lentisphaeria bacterium]